MPITIDAGLVLAVGGDPEAPLIPLSEVEEFVAQAKAYGLDDTAQVQGYLTLAVRGTPSPAEPMQAVIALTQDEGWSAE